MDRCEVLVTTDLVTVELQEGHLQLIARVNPRVRVRPAWRPYHNLRRRLLGQEGGFTTPEEKELNQMLAEAEVLFTYYILPDLLQRCPRLRWIQLSSHGADHLLGSGILESGVKVTCARGAYAGPVAEFALMLMLMLAKQAPRQLHNQQRCTWEEFTLLELEGHTVGIIGLGSIGQALARMCSALGMRVMATKRDPSSWKPGLAAVDELVPPQALDRLLAASDYVVLAVPLTYETKGMLGEAQLRAMKPTAFLINVARGKVVDERALIRALREDWIAGAGLEVFHQEPLPPESELWGLPNAIITPHMAGTTERVAERATEAFVDNLRRYLQGEELLHQVEPERGY